MLMVKIFFWPPNYELNITSPNEESFRAMAMKMSFLTDSLYSTHNEIYATSGDTTDYAYESLGVIAYTVELGSAFHDKCSYFEENVIDNAMNSVLYGARVSKSPFLFPKGPDLVSCTVSSDEANTDDTFDVTIKISDSQIDGNHTSVDQNITSVYCFLDSHPYDVNASPILNMSSSFWLEEEILSFTLSLSDVSAGKHTLFFQAYDEYGPGPVYAKFIEAGNRNSGIDVDS